MRDRDLEWIDHLEEKSMSLMVYKIDGCLDPNAWNFYIERTAN